MFSLNLKIALSLVAVSLTIGFAAGWASTQDNIAELKQTVKGQNDAIKLLQKSYNACGEYRSGSVSDRLRDPNTVY